MYMNFSSSLLGYLCQVPTCHLVFFKLFNEKLCIELNLNHFDRMDTQHVATLMEAALPLLDSDDSDTDSSILRSSDSEGDVIPPAPPRVLPKSRVCFEQVQKMDADEFQSHFRLSPSEYITTEYFISQAMIEALARLYLVNQGQSKSLMWTQGFHLK